ncbi:hypothetical protein [Natronospira bacteriovora]|uniref:DUF3899 domain-containing protein n=1 Tax=Natronospira bacteriovora TaxID=3069753 RepID=A0ABU0W806_9GAMM|nr:hypothetical protein [Natronospira sp. AB-CW4]MDQ2069883.1 hypothetical protein [Natronospira sp. AB-CW4]
MNTLALFFDALIVFFLVVGLFAAAIGLILMLAPAGFERLASRMNREWSTRRAMKELEVPRYYERFFFRHHRWVGALILIACLYFFFAFVFRMSPAEAALAMPGITWLWEGLFWFLIVANSAAAILALVILLRPSALKPLEAFANQWVSVRKATRGLDKEFDDFDNFARRHHRATGFLLLLAGVFLAVSFGVLYSG